MSAVSWALEKVQYVPNSAAILCTAFCSDGLVMALLVLGVKSALRWDWQADWQPFYESEQTNLVKRSDIKYTSCSHTTLFTLLILYLWSTRGIAI